MKKEKTRKWSAKWLILLIPLAVVLLPAAGLLIMGAAGASDRYDDFDAILAEHDDISERKYWSDGKGAVWWDMGDISALRRTYEPDGSAAVWLDKGDVYAFLRDSGIGAELKEKRLDANGVLGFGFRISEGKILVNERQKILRFFPMSFRATCELTTEGTEAVLRTVKVVAGSRKTLKEERWPALFREELRIDLSELEIPETIRDVSVSGSVLRAEYSWLPEDDWGKLQLDGEFFSAEDFFALPRLSEEVRQLSRKEGLAITPAKAGEFASDSQDLRAAFAALFACATDGSAASFTANAGGDDRREIWDPVLEDAAQRRAAAENALAAAQGGYERLVFTIREMYRSGRVKLGNDAFYDLDGGVLTPAAISRIGLSETDSRFVFLFSSADSGELQTADMPTIEEVPKKNWKTAMRADLELRPDLGVVLTTGSGRPVLIYRRGDDSLVIREIPEDVYVPALVSPTIPRLDVDTLPDPEILITRPGGEGWTRGLIFLFTPFRA